MDLVCLLTMVLILSPLGQDSRYEGEQLRGECQPTDLSFLIRKPNILQIDQAFRRFQIPLPRNQDRIRVTYLLGAGHAYLGSCLAGLRSYVYPDTTCLAVMVRIGPKTPV